MNVHITVNSTAREKTLLKEVSVMVMDRSGRRIKAFTILSKSLLSRC